MTKRWIGCALALTGLFAMACGGSESPPPQQAPPPQPVVQQATPCAEQWVHMPMLITFPTSGTEIDSQNREILREMVRTAQARTDIRRVRVEGHTDTCGNELNNMMLSQNRAVAVMNELVMMGVPREMLETMGHGSTQPRANESCGQHQTLSEQSNRRVEFTLLVCR